MPKSETDKYIKALKNGETNLILQLYKDMYPNFRALVFKGGGTETDVNDILWGNLEKLRLKLYEPEFELKGSIRAYLFKMCKYEWLNTMKKRNRLFFKESSEMDNMLREMEASNHYRPDTVMEARRIEYVVQGVLWQLPEKCREMLFLKYVRELRYSEICEQLGIEKEGTARKKVYHCKDKLRKTVLDSPYLPELMDCFKFIKPKT